MSLAFGLGLGMGIHHTVVCVWKVFLVFGEGVEPDRVAAVRKHRQEKL